MAVNLSFGNTYGSHDGGGLLERYLDSLAQMGRFVFVTGAGNEGDSGGHARPVIVPGRSRKSAFRWAIMKRDSEYRSGKIMRTGCGSF